jgi:hypothetical protein
VFVDGCISFAYFIREVPSETSSSAPVFGVFKEATLGAVASQRPSVWDMYDAALFMILRNPLIF